MPFLDIDPNRPTRAYVADLKKLRVADNRPSTDVEWSYFFDPLGTWTEEERAVQRRCDRLVGSRFRARAKVAPAFKGGVKAEIIAKNRLVLEGVVHVEGGEVLFDHVELVRNKALGDTQIGDVIEFDARMKSAASGPPFEFYLTNITNLKTVSHTNEL